MILFQNTEKSFDNQLVLQKIDLEIKKGELMVLLGASGSGKTTLLRMINGLENPDGGSVSISGKSLAQHGILDIRKEIGYVIQKVGLFPHYSVFDNVATVLRLKKQREDSIKDKVNIWLSKVGLASSQYAHKFPNELSGGEAQRVGLARALVSQPKMILLDEPFSALDPVSRVRIRDEFRTIQREEKLTAVMVTHDVLEAVSLADRICLLANGKIQQVGTPKDIIFHPKNDLVKDFVKGDLFQASLEAVSLKDLSPFLKESSLGIDDQSQSVLKCLQMVDSQYHPVILQAFNQFKEDYLS